METKTKGAAKPGKGSCIYEPLSLFTRTMVQLVCNPRAIPDTAPDMLTIDGSSYLSHASLSDTCQCICKWIRRTD